MNLQEFVQGFLAIAIFAILSPVMPAVAPWQATEPNGVTAVKGNNWSGREQDASRNVAQICQQHWGVSLEICHCHLLIGFKLIPCVHSRLSEVI